MVGKLRPIRASRSLERKCLVYFSLALLSSVFLAFWCVQIVAQSLVRATTQQAARDFANTSVGWRHLTAVSLGGTRRDRNFAGKASGELGGQRELLMLRKYMLNQEYQSPSISPAWARETVRETQPLWSRSKQPVHTTWGKAGNTLCIPNTPSRLSLE